jgi:hypothetical protein
MQAGMGNKNAQVSFIVHYLFGYNIPLEGFENKVF